MLRAQLKARACGAQPVKAEKLLYLEGIRGIAAMVVVASHFVYAFYPQLKGTVNSGAEITSFVALIGMTPIGIFHEGRFAVRLFFVLSGVVLSLSFFRTGDREKAVSGAVRRYFRLTIPILAAVLVAYLLHRSGLFFNGRVAASTSNEWLLPFYEFVPSVALLLREVSTAPFWISLPPLPMTAFYGRWRWNSSARCSFSAFYFCWGARAFAIMRTLRFCRPYCWQGGPTQSTSCSALCSVTSSSTGVRLFGFPFGLAYYSWEQVCSSEGCGRNGCLCRERHIGTASAPSS